MEKVLLYFHDEKTIDAAITFFQNENIAFTIVNDTHLEDTIKNLLETNYTLKQSSTAFSFSFVFFANMKQDRVIEVINKMNQEKLQISHKAMLTKTNIDWNLKALLAEIEEEQAYMMSYQKLIALLKQANSMDETQYEEASFTFYRNAFLKAYTIYKTKGVEKAKIDACIKEMEITFNNLKRGSNS